MIRRYDMSRSDNAPINSRCMMPISPGAGDFWIHTNIKVRAITLSPVNVPEGTILEVDQGSLGGEGFRVMYRNAPDESVFVEFSFVIQ